MKKTVLIYGLIIGALLSANMVLMVSMMYSNPDFKAGYLLGIAVLLYISLPLFFGLRNYRNKELQGFITFGQAFKTGALIALVFSTVYVSVWLIDYYLFVTDFMDVFTAQSLKNCAPENMAAKTAEMANYNEMYKNPLLVILLTYVEVLPLGLAFALICALILKKKQTSVS